MSSKLYRLTAATLAVATLVVISTVLAGVTPAPAEDFPMVCPAPLHLTT